jgi:exodeoxyribonuclease-5
MNFNDDQKYFIESVLKDYIQNNYGPILLNASAGTGKTSVAKELSKNKNLYGKIKFVAPTHKACSILRSEIPDVVTIHRFLNAKNEYNKDTGDLVFKFYTGQHYNEIIIVDECSMVSKEMFIEFEKLFEKNIVIFMGDELQLPPINQEDYDDINKSNKISKKSPTFDIENKFTFTKNMRSDKLVSTLMLENARKACFENKMPKQLVEKNMNEILNIFKENINTDISVIVLAYTNVAVNSYNQKIRCKLFDVEDINNLKPYYEGEKLIFSGCRNEKKVTYYSSSIINIINLSTETLIINFKECDCQESEFARTKCKIHKFRRGTLTLDFYKIIDQYNNVWYKPINQKQFYLLSWQFKEFCKIKKESRWWAEYYNFMNNYNADLKYQYAMTIHKSQGSQYNIVFVDRVNLVGCTSKDQLLKVNGYYTAISRMISDVYDIKN